MKWIAQWILRRAGWVSLGGTLLAVVGLYYSALLYKNLRTDLEELLPSTARSVLDLGEVTQRLESIDNLAVLIFSPDSKAGKRFQDDLARKLEAYPKTTIASVEYKIDRELKFFGERRPLYMDFSDLSRIRNYIRDRLEYEKSLYNPLNIFSNEEIPEPKLDFKALRNKYEKKVSAYSRFPDGYYSTPDGTKRVVLVYLPGKSAGIDSAKKLKAAVEESVSALSPKSYHPEMVIRYSGGVQNTIEEQAALVADLELSTVIVTLIVTLAMLVFYRFVLPTMALVISLFMGTFWTFGVSFFAVGYLNANSAFLGSIVIGNGINFGIIFLARYLEERRGLKPHGEALTTAMTATSPATVTAALAAGLSYGSLILTGFRGFKQFGIIGLIGMALCWISAYTLLPALLTVFERFRPIRIDPSRAPRNPLASWVARFVSQYPGPIWAVSLFLTLVSAATFVRFNSNILEADLAKLRNKESMEKGSGYLSKYVDEIFQRYLSPMVILPKDREHAREIAERLKEKKRSEGKSSLIVSVQTLDDFIPQDQREKVAVLEDIRRLLPPRLLRRISPEERQLAYEFLNQSTLKTINTPDLPELILNKFTEKDRSVGKLVLVEPPLTNEIKEREKLIGLIREIRQVTDSVAPGTPVAGTLPITADMLEAIVREGPKASLMAFIAVILLVVFIFRNFQTISLVLFSLLMGVLWMFGMILGFDLKINFLNFIALPITFGIGVDYSVNIFQRYREEGADSIIRVIRDTGGAVGLASFTTVVGYGSLLIAQNQAFVSFGLLAVLGELTCLFAALFSFPAFLLLLDRRRQRRLALNPPERAASSADSQRPWKNGPEQTL